MGNSIYVFFFGDHLDLLCVNLETKVSSQFKQQMQYMVAWGSGGEVRGGIRAVESQFSYSKVNH